MANNDVILRFEKVSFDFGHNKPILSEVDFTVRRGSKITFMGQNGAGKSTIFKLIMGELSPHEGMLHIEKGLTIATARQVIPRTELSLTVREFFEKCFSEKVYDIDPRIDAILDVVHLKVPHDRIISSFSGGQQARLLLASALIQKPDLLLLDEPTNNLDKAGIAHLKQFLIDYKKTVIVISHDAEFLNAFTQGVLYLNVYKHTVEQYVGNYLDVVANITVQIEKEARKNAQLQKEIQAKKDQANVFANKGGGMRLVAKKMREKAEALEDDVVEARREDKTIRSFRIPVMSEAVGEMLHLSSVSVIKDHTPKTKKVNVSLKKKQHLLLSGPNGIGKSTLLESIANNTAAGMTLAEGVRIGYYRQDFSTLDFESTVYDALAAVMERHIDQDLRATAAGFLITEQILKTKIGSLSEGQKGLVAFARLVLMKPDLLILDEPTNHMNFRHLPVIAKALTEYEGALILVSHVPEFVKQIRIDDELSLGE